MSAAATSAIAFLLEQARMLRELAGQQKDPELRADLLALADRCETLANHMRGNGSSATAQ